MTKYILKRILIAIPTLLGITIIDYAIMCFAGSPLEMLQGARISQEAIAARRCAAMVGQTVRVLVEERGKNGLLSGRTEGSVIVEFPGDDALIGQFCQVTVTKARNWILQGEKAD